MDGRRERSWCYAAVSVLLAGCGGPDPVAPPLDGARDLGAPETSAPIDGATSPDVFDAVAPTDHGEDVAAADASISTDHGEEAATDVTAPIDGSTSPDVADATAPLDRGDDAVADTLASTDGGRDAGAADVAALSAEFTMIYETILRPRCATSGCHVDGSSSPRLSMSDAASTYARLVNVRDECSFNLGSRIRVVPFDPSMSAILLFNQDGLCGRRHNILLPSSYSYAEQEADASRFRAWIMAGAR